MLLVIKRIVLHGWRTQANELSKPYECRKSELSVEGGCILWGSCAGVPPPGRAPIIEMLHDGHPGVFRMKYLAKWWPGLDAELEAKVKSCEACQVNRWSPPKSPLHPWEWPAKHGLAFMLIFVDLFWVKSFLSWWMLTPNGWRLLALMFPPHLPSMQAIQVLRQVFAVHGLPEVLVSDNGISFTCTEFQTFVERNGFRHIRSAPYHPAINGLDEQVSANCEKCLNL